MGKLIDADALRQKLSEMEDEYKAKIREDCDDDPFSDGILSALFTVFQVIANQPTAYDIEKVVAELESRYRIYSGSSDGYDSGKYYAYEEAIEIVRKGGVE